MNEPVPNHVFLGKYKPSRFVGRGGMAIVYLGQEPRSARQVVIKVMQERFAVDPKCREAFRHEMDFMSEFRHPYAVEMFEASLDDPHGPCIIMEYVNGIPLEDLLAKEKRLTPTRVGNLLGPLCMVLQALHERGYVHRDLKTGNIMVTGAGTKDESIKVLDFGLARKMTGTTAEPYIPLEKIKDFAEGTPAYMSPEQLDGSRMDHRADIYSVGVILYELLSGRRPFDDDDIDKLFAALTEQPPPTFQQIGATGVHIKIETLVRECLAKKPERRPQSFRAVATRYEDSSGQKLWYEQIYQSFLPPPSAAAANDKMAPAQANARAETPVARAKSARCDALFNLEAWMPEAIAVMKLRGFLNDIDGEVTESVPGMIRVYLKHARAASAAAKPASSGGFLSWFGPAKKDEPPAQDVDLIEMEVHMEKHPSGKANHLQITLMLRTTGEQSLPRDWKPWSDKIVTDLSSYLMATRV